MYIVICEVPTNDPYDPYMHGEYSGIAHSTEDAAEREREEAMKNKNIMDAWIEER